MCLHTYTHAHTHVDLMSYNKVNLPLREGSALNVATKKSSSKAFQTEMRSLDLGKDCETSVRPRGGLLSLAVFPCFFLLNPHTIYHIVCVACQF